MEFQIAAVVGAGTMGCGIAEVLGVNGVTVWLFDADPGQVSRGLEGIAQRLERRGERAGLDASVREGVLSRLGDLCDLGRVAEADLVVEAVPEKMDLKQTVFAELDRHARPGAVLASNTSGLDIACLAAATDRPESVIGVHFFNPPPVMPLVEVVRHATTSDETFAAVWTLIERLGKTPIAVANSPGFAVNRILFPMINEAICALQEGVANAADIDRTMVLGASHPIGPLALADFVGLDLTRDILIYLAEAFDDDKYRPCSLLLEMVAQGNLGRKSGKGFFHYPD